MKHMDPHLSEYQNHVCFISEDDCRYPDQVRFLMRHEGLRCVNSPDVAGSSRDVAQWSNPNVLFYVALQTLSLLTISAIIGTF
jgi:hypothetical protein